MKYRITIGNDNYHCGEIISLESQEKELNCKPEEVPSDHFAATWLKEALNLNTLRGKEIERLTFKQVPKQVGYNL